MQFLYALLMGAYLPTPEYQPGWHQGPPTHPVATQVFDALNMLGPRLDLLLALAKWRALPDESQMLEQKLVPRMRNRFKERSTVAHGTWGICLDYPDDLILKQTYGSSQIWSARDFTNISERTLDLHRDFGTFIHVIYERFRAKIHP